ncbi:hypothetical protein Pmar_PMAR024732 [Perkinsus marinus ATCC 50983]|uniref:Uncharacterized protein n=1 Tax=Perkinsus marinus (strain ATCC 50983 / TXsc) TaxID=423536 RepID=C5M159_PERM5|nr:hypothetical protein Pmar_PMAR024732 [Perkinsus marinus ATCC 50983]EEQ97289.1 hypothetical protein Pmar_PMAR024732 [Perkinsus marinus ATCC 50983]|eukprot:XP_002764572.1 hypothetical protein Pmar_PMAR024732 [Perkinsus marinus ATCC 50983]
MAVESNSVAAVAVLARHTNLLILEKEENNHPLAAMMGMINKEPILDPMVIILKAPLLIRYEGMSRPKLADPRKLRASILYAN